MRHSLPLFGAIAAVAAVTFESLNVPLGAMIGPMLIIGLTVHLTKVIQAPGLYAHHFAILLLGLALGSRVTADVFERVKLWPFSLIILIVTMVMILWIVGKLNQRLLALDRISAHMAAAPGNLSSALAVTEHYGGALSQVAVYQSLRLAFLTLLVPFLFVVPKTPQPIVLFQHTDYHLADRSQCLLGTDRSLENPPCHDSWADCRCVRRCELESTRARQTEYPANVHYIGHDALWLAYWDRYCRTGGPHLGKDRPSCGDLNTGRYYHCIDWCLYHPSTSWIPIS